MPKVVQSVSDIYFHARLYSNTRTQGAACKKYAQLRYRRVPNEWVAVGKYFRYGGEGVG